ncbi:CHAT domain-containing protein [Bradyrhizobium lablabi]|uniref:CHAT domain-containing protein n=3 Tax=Bradyrhizobium TaxID=374 RepID=A0ABY0PYT7_9BRAD|nr:MULTISPECIES: CHAT domain-containing protein [Bradyrhizobium]SDJ17905.1 CHAT domain-containing protein [Bradyrhizobium ottawaense]SEC84688.1 CHAT domain-containing protein [Bradyrhizobium lablabi]
MARTILFLAANPKNTARLRLDEEFREVQSGLERARKRDQFVLAQRLAPRSADIRRAMLDIRPGIVHFCGHGSGSEGLVFEDPLGNAKLVSTRALGGLFKLFADSVDCVLLNACYSAVQARGISKHIQYVIGMKKAIGDRAAIEFSVAFYDALGSGESYEFAYHIACNALSWSTISEHLTPILITNDGVGKKRLADSKLAAQHPSGAADEDENYYLGNLFRIWTHSGLLQEDAEGYKYVLSAFFGLLVANGTKNPPETMQQFLNEAKREASEATSTPKSMFGFLEFDVSGPYESLDVEEGYFRLWKLACQERRMICAYCMATVRLALTQSVGEARQQQLIGSWQKRLNL